MSCLYILEISPLQVLLFVDIFLPVHGVSFHFVCGLLCLLCLVAQLSLTLGDPMDCSPPDSSVHGDYPGKTTRVGCHALLQGIFPTQGLNPGVPHCRQILYQLSHQGSPVSILYCEAILAHHLQFQISLQPQRKFLKITLSKMVPCSQWVLNSP